MVTCGHRPALPAALSAAAVTAAAATAAGATAATAAGTILRFIDAQRASAHVEAIQRFHCLLCFRLGHLDETETARAARITIRREGYGFNRAVLCEQIAHLAFCRSKRQVAYVDLSHSNILKVQTNARITEP
jgi:hypothetical protein